MSHWKKNYVAKDYASAERVLLNISGQKRKNKILLPLGGDLYILDNLDSSLRKLIAAEGKAILDPQFSPDARWVSYVQDAELYILPVEGGEPRQITSGARGTGKVNGAAEYVAQEEMGRAHGYWWSPDSRKIAFTEVDETHIPVYRIMHQGKAETGPAAQEDHRYPFAGRENARVRLGVTDIEGTAPLWMEINSEKYEYIARVDWLPDGNLTAPASKPASKLFLTWWSLIRQTVKPHCFYRKRVISGSICIIFFIR